MSIPAPHIPPLLSHFVPMRLIGPLAPTTLPLYSISSSSPFLGTYHRIHQLPILKLPAHFFATLFAGISLALFMRLTTVCQVKSPKKFASLSFFFLPWVCGHMNASCCKNKSCFGPLTIWHERALQKRKVWNMGE